jgi:hypothetical protein
VAAFMRRLARQLGERHGCCAVTTTKPGMHC